MFLFYCFIEIVVSDGKAENRKRKQKAASTLVPVSKRKNVAATEDPSNASEKAKELSESDKELLQRWSKMQQVSKPFVHPIRNHMDELNKIKAEAIQQQHQLQGEKPATTSIETVRGQKIVNRVSTLQFTNLVPTTKDGSYVLVPENTITRHTTSSSVTNPIVISPSISTNNESETPTPTSISVISTGITMTTTLFSEPIATVTTKTSTVVTTSIPSGIFGLFE